MPRNFGRTKTNRVTDDRARTQLEVQPMPFVGHVHPGDMTTHLLRRIRELVAPAGGIPRKMNSQTGIISMNMFNDVVLETPGL